MVDHAATDRIDACMIGRSRSILFEERDLMVAWTELEQHMARALDLSRRPVAVAFRDTPPAGVPAFTGTEPSGCSFWRLAGGGRSFYTIPADHHNCAVGSHTHAIALPPSRAAELAQTLGFMSGLGYVRMEEVPGIPVLPTTPGAVVYAPLGETPVDPDVVLVAGRPGRLMLLLEAAGRAGVTTKPGLLGRPTCMALPMALAGGAVASAGCIGNRVYTDLGDDELYVAIPGRDVARVVGELATIVTANSTLADYHRGRRRDLSTE
jgi:uncharacterized protein (DUF169 family)